MSTACHHCARPISLSKDESRTQCQRVVHKHCREAHNARCEHCPEDSAVRLLAIPSLMALFAWALLAPYLDSSGDIIRLLVVALIAGAAATALTVFAIRPQIQGKFDTAGWAVSLIMVSWATLFWADVLFADAMPERRYEVRSMRKVQGKGTSFYAVIVDETGQQRELSVPYEIFQTNTRILVVERSRGILGTRYNLRFKLPGER